jgi:hypothetical protein
MPIAATIGLFLGCVFSPYGIPLTLDRARVVQTASSGLITEWLSLPEAMKQGHTVLATVAIATAIVVCCAGAFVGFKIRRRECLKTADVYLIAFAAMSVPLGVAGLGAARFLFPGLFLALPSIALAATTIVRRLRSALFSRGYSPSSRVLTYTTGQFWTGILAIASLAVIPIVAARLTAAAIPPEQTLAQALPRGCNLFSDPGSAGPVLLIRPDAKVWIDGRVDFYGRHHALENAQILAGAKSVPSGATCIIIPQTTDSGAPAPAAISLDRSSHWKRVGQSGNLALWLPLAGPRS